MAWALETSITNGSWLSTHLAVIAVAHFFGNDGYGIHIHSGTPAEQRGWYSTVMWMQNEYWVRWSVDFNFCVANAC